MEIIVPGNFNMPRVPSCTCYCETNYVGCPAYKPPVCPYFECPVYVKLQ